MAASMTGSAFESTRTAKMSPRRLPVGAEIRENGTTHFRVWAPAAGRVDVLIEGRDALTLVREADGYFAGEANASACARYRFCLDGAESYPDPASRFQPEGPHGPSEVVDPSFDWADHAWRGLSIEGPVLYELHVGTFTPEGTWAAAERELPE